MQSTNLPAKYLVPFATNDGAKVEIPVTTATVGRASQSLGFPPITGQPPEVGGLPPQLEDFNGAVNQIARVAWWSQLGGLFPYDAAFATDANIGGYPQGAVLQSATDRTVAWLSTAQNNVADPDATGTGWVPYVAYGGGTLSTAGGTTTLALPIAAHAPLLISGTLSSNAIVVLPSWARDWTINNSTTGAFSVTVKTAAGAGVVIPQNGAPTRVTGDGTNISQPAQNIAPAVTATQPLQLGQATGRLLNVQTFTPGAGTYTPSAGATRIRARLWGGGGGGGASSGAVNGINTGGGGGGYIEWFGLLSLLGAGPTYAYTVGASGPGGVTASQTGTSGGITSVASTQLVANGGTGGGTGGAGVGGSVSVLPPGQIMAVAGRNGQGGSGVTGPLGGQGGPTFGGMLGSPRNSVGDTSSLGCGGPGAGAGTATVFAGGTGGAGLLIIEEYS